MRWALNFWVTDMVRKITQFSLQKSFKTFPTTTNLYVFLQRDHVQFNKSYFGVLFIRKFSGKLYSVIDSA